MTSGKDDVQHTSPEGVPSVGRAIVCISCMPTLSPAGATGGRNDSPVGSLVVSMLAGSASVSQPGGATAELTSSIAILSRSSSDTVQGSVILPHYRCRN